jgi:hypothetical protein
MILCDDSSGSGSACVSRATASPARTDGVPAVANFSEKIVSARRRNQHARRARYPEISE